MSEGVTTGLTPGAGWKQIDANRATAAAAFTMAKAAFAEAAYMLLGAWETVEMCGGKVQIDGYPFPESFDDVVRSIQDWAEKNSVDSSMEAG
jgi:hypothetical protein